jgi:phosphatidylglycerophosphate synthase
MEKPSRKKFRQETVIHSYIHRPISLEIIRLIWNTNITANQITIFRVIINILALISFSYGTLNGFIIGFIAFQVNEILDHVDGMYSRLKKQTSKVGAFLEVTFDDLFASSQGLLGFSIAYGAYNITNDFIYIWIFISMAIGHALNLIYLINFESHKICDKKSFHNINHDSEEYKQIIGVPFLKSMKNLLFTIYIWRNEVLVWSALFYFIGIEYKVDLILIALLFHSLIYNLQWIKKVFVAYKVAKRLDNNLI